MVRWMQLNRKELSFHDSSWKVSTKRIHHFLCPRPILFYRRIQTFVSNLEPERQDQWKILVCRPSMRLMVYYWLRMTTGSLCWFHFYSCTMDETESFLEIHRHRRPEWKKPAHMRNKYITSHRKATSYFKKQIFSARTNIK